MGFERSVDSLKLWSQSRFLGRPLSYTHMLRNFIPLKEATIKRKIALEDTIFGCWRHGV